MFRLLTVLAFLLLSSSVCEGAVDQAFSIHEHIASSLFISLGVVSLCCLVLYCACLIIRVAHKKTLEEYFQKEDEKLESKKAGTYSPEMNSDGETVLHSMPIQIAPLIIVLMTSHICWGEPLGSRKRNATYLVRAGGCCSINSLVEF